MSAAALLAGVAGALAAAALVELAALRAARPATTRLVRRPLRTLLVRLGRAAGAPSGGSEVADVGLLAAAGSRMSAPDLASVRAGAGLLALAGGALHGGVLPGRLGLAALVVAPLAAREAPIAILRRRARARGARMSAELPDVLDLLRVCVAAGATPLHALAQVGARHPGELAAELGRAAARASGGLAFSTALDDLERRAPAPALPALTAALRRAHAQGAPLEPALEALAGDARAKRARERQEAAARAAPLIQLVVALLLVPSVMLLVAAALVPSLAGVA